MADDYVLARKKEDKAITDRRPAPAGSSKGAQAGTKGEGVGTLLSTDRTRTNTSGDKRCYQCGKWGHLMFNCPNRWPAQARAAGKPALFGNFCPDVAWNKQSCKYLRQWYL